MFTSKIPKPQPQLRSSAVLAGKVAPRHPAQHDSAVQDSARQSTTLKGPEARLPWDFSQAPVSARVQTKLVVGSVDDPLEREADRMADQVMRTSSGPAVAASSGVTLQRKCAACEEAEKARGTIRSRRHGNHDAPGVDATSIVSTVLRSAGQPIHEQNRRFFEQRFGRDFSQVRIHADGHAAESAQCIGARAYTVGRHIVFAAGQYAPGSNDGRHLLAHELTHTIQQGASHVRRRADTREQDVTGIVERHEERPRIEEEQGGATEQVIRRSTDWKGATPHPTVNVANVAVGGDAPITWEMLNGTMLKTNAAADGAIKVPGVKTTAPAATGGDWVAKVDTVPAQEGAADETVLNSGPWSKVITKVRAGTLTGLAACAGAGNSTLTVTGDPSDDAVFKANRRHEDEHVKHVKKSFEDNIVAWDTKVEAAKTAGTGFKAASEADAIAKLWTAMGNTPKAAARAYSAQVGSSGGAFHRTAAGGPMQLANPTANATCSTCGLEVTNPG